MLRDPLPKREQQEDEGRFAAAASAGAPPITTPRALFTPQAMRTQWQNLTPAPGTY